jgi:hypothetical protein
MDTYPGSISLDELIALERRHIYVLPRASEEMRVGNGLHSNHHASHWRLAADRIISLVSLKLVAARVKGGEAVAKGVNAAINSAIEGVFNSSEPGDDTPTRVPPSFVHWPGPPPGPYLVAAELTQYSNVLTDKTAQAEFGEIINTFATRIAGATAGRQ